MRFNVGIGAFLVGVLFATLASCQQDAKVEQGASDANAGQAQVAKDGSGSPQTTGSGAAATKPQTKPKPKPKPGGGDDPNGEPQDSADGKSGGSASGAASGAQLPKEKQRVVLDGSRGDKVPGYVWLPARTAGQRFPAVLTMYGIKGNKDDGSIARAAELLNDAGFVIMTIDWPGTGERGNIGNTARITDTDVLSWTVNDYVVALNFLQNLPEVDGLRMGYVGASMGAMTGLALTARDPRIKAMVAIVPIPNPLWGEDDPSARIQQIAPRPVLCISTNDNSDFSSSVCQNTVAPGQAKALPGGHELEGFRDQVVNESKAFLTQSLKP